MENSVPPISPGSSSNSSGGNSTQSLIGFPPDVARLESALRVLPPDGNASELALHFIAPMAKAVREFPEVEAKMQTLACKWACGELHDGKHSGLLAITRNGKSGKAYFDDLWNHFLTDTTYKGKTRTLGSIYFLAKEAGWTPE